MGRFDGLFDSFKLKKKGEEEAASLGRNICGLPVDTTRALKTDLKTTANESVLIFQFQAFCSYRHPFLDAHAGSTCAATAGPATLGPTCGYTPRPRAQQGGGIPEVVRLGGARRRYSRAEREAAARIPELRRRRGAVRLLPRSRARGRDELGPVALATGAVRAARVGGAAAALPAGRWRPDPAVGRVAGPTSR